ncbi:DUF2149 domain-containing protein [Aestuariicella sp. G3-2]|uniref:DUF2149 domain-containing protein n=1 Tax=Pseudomaricurvus albidus TaxID=2842452 RepID=UPI001C0E2900|nr:DUF2149 domain-containing protein [Aestuariicella albida]MBU3070719.1 DUF2149 domain-containing protein [Aestuariicella albida]
MSSRWNSDRFSPADEEPLGPMANLLDLMLVFACGLIAALIAMSEQLQEHFQSELQDTQAKTVIERGKELPNLPGDGAVGGDGYESVGQVYRDPKTGKLILIAP